MNQELLDTLSGEELVALGIKAGAQGDAAAAMACLKAACAREDAGAMTHFLLSAEYAQAGMTERAVGEMEAALAIDPAFSLVRLQLGLLLLTAADVERSDAVLAPLEELDETDPLRHFGAGLRHLMRDEFEPARHCLRAGIEGNAANAPLNANMQLILDHLPPPQADDAGGEAASAANAEDDAAARDDNAGWRHMLISTYTGQGPH